jgi:hypothetical protein
MLITPVNAGGKGELPKKDARFRGIDLESNVGKISHE